MPRFSDRSPNRFRFSAQRSRDRRSPSMDRSRIRRLRRVEANRVLPRSTSPPNRFKYSQWYCLGVFGMSYRTTEGDLRRIFQRHGPIERIRIVYDPVTGESRGFGFVYLRNRRDALAAREHCDGLLFDRRHIRVDFSTTDRPHSPTPGQYMGKEGREERMRKQPRKQRELSASSFGCVVRRIPMERKSPSPSVPYVHPRFRPLGSRSESSEC